MSITKQNIVIMLQKHGISFLSHDIVKDDIICSLLTVHSGDIGLVFSKETDILMDLAHLSEVVGEDSEKDKENQVTIALSNQSPVTTKLFSPIIEDTGKHYRYSYKGINLDPYRIAEIYKLQPGAQFTIVKKGLKMGERGHKSMEQDLKDIITACQRKLQMMKEDGEME